MKKTTLSKFKPRLFITFLLLGIAFFWQTDLLAQTGCTATPGYPDAPTSLVCPGVSSPEPIFTETFDTGFGVFTEDAAPGGTNDLTLSTDGDTPSTGTGAECSASGLAGDEYIFLESTNALTGEVHCMTASIDLTAEVAPLEMSFWYYMFGDNIGELTVNIDGNQEFIAGPGQIQTGQTDPWTQGSFSLDAYAGSIITVQICMSEGAGTSTFEGDISIDHIQVFTCATNPIIICPSDIMADNDPGVCTAVVNFSDAVAIDPEGGPVTVVQTMGPPSGSDFPVGDTIIEFTATDSEGDQSSCQFTITVNDVEPPMMTCPADITVDNDPGICGAVVNYPDPQLMDNCFAGGPAGTYDMTIDFTNPALMSTNAFAFTGASVGAIGDATLEVRTFGDIDGTGGNEEAWTIFDEDANTTGMIGATGVFADQCNTTLMETFIIPGALIDAWAADGQIDFTGTDVEGNINLTLCGGDFLELRLTYDFSQQPPVPYTVVSGQASGTVFPVGTTTNVLEYTDPGGNTVQCSFDVTVNDTEAPVITCQGQPGTVSVTEDFNSGLPAGWSTVITSGTCDWENGTDLPTGDDFATPGMFFDDDACGNGAPASIVHLLSDIYDASASTTITLGYDVAFQESGNQEFIVEVWDGATWQQVAFYDADLDPDIQTESIDVSAFANADFQVRWTFDDLTGSWGWHGGIDNFQLDYEVPATAFDVILDANGMATIPASDLILSATDNCGPVTVTATSGAPLPVSLQTTFGGGNRNFGNFFDINALNDITVNSFDVNSEAGAGINMELEIYAKSGTWVGFETNAAAWTLLTTITVPTNATGTPTPLNLTLGYFIPSGETHAFYIRPTDPAGVGGLEYTNGTAVGNVFASDANMEFLEGGAKESFTTGTLFQPRVFNGNIHYAAGGATSTTIDFTCDDVGESFIQVFVTDSSGNESVCTATVNVIDDTAPVLVCQDATIELGADGTAEVDPMALVDLANTVEACGLAVLAVDVTDVDCSDIGTPITVTLFVSDPSGNLASCTSTITVVDLLGPEVTCPADQTVDPGPGNLFYEVPDYTTDPAVTATDNCTDPVTVFTQDPPAGTLLPDGVHTITICAEDDFGNEGCCTFELTVESILGVDDNALNNAIVMYPNPAGEQVTISNGSSILLNDAMIYDVNGKLIQTIDLQNMQGEQVIDISQLASGVYMVQITSENSSVVKRLIKE